MIYLGRVTSISLLGERSLVQRMGVRAESWEREEGGGRKRKTEGEREREKEGAQSRMTQGYMCECIPPVHGFVQVLVSVSRKDDDPIILLNLLSTSMDVRLGTSSPYPSSFHSSTDIPR